MKYEDSIKIMEEEDMTEQANAEERMAQLYEEAQELAGFSPGEQVEVLGRAASGTYGWGTVWVTEMDSFIGENKSWTILEVHPMFGIRLKNAADDEYYFPFFVLRSREVRATPPSYTLRGQVNAIAEEYRICDAYREFAFELLSSFENWMADRFKLGEKDGN